MEDQKQILISGDQTLSLLALSESVNLLHELWKSLDPGSLRFLAAQSLLRLTWLLSRSEIPDSFRSEILSLNRHLQLSLDIKNVLERSQELVRLHEPH